jgi:O-antigen ligase
MTRSLARLGPLQLSSVELFLYVAVGMWGLGFVASVRRDDALWKHLSFPDLGVAVWALALVASAAFAPTERPTAIKFALRSLAGIAVYFAARDRLRFPGAALSTSAAIGAGALVAAALAIAEIYLPGSRSLLLGFHDQTFEVMGRFRASGPFQFPNIAAMYLAMALPILVVVGAARRARLHRLTITSLLALVLLWALVLTGSRAGLAAGAMALAGLALAARGLPSLRRLALASLGGLMVLLLIAGASSSPLMLRLRFWQDGRWYRSMISEAKRGTIPPTVMVDSTIEVALEVRNEGEVSWPAAGPQPVQLSWRWLDRANDRRVVSVGPLTSLPHDVPPGGTVTVHVALRTPGGPGRYILRWDLIHRDVTWFSERGDLGRSDLIDVIAPVGAAVVTSRPSVPDTDSLPSEPTIELSRSILWRAGLAAFLEHPLLGAGPDNFRHIYGRYIGRPDADARFHANSLYIETLADMGLVGLLALAALVTGLARAAYRALTRTEDARERTLILGAAAALGAFLLHGTLDYFFEFTPTYTLFWLVAGMLVALDEQRQDGTIRTESRLQASTIGPMGLGAPRMEMPSRRGGRPELGTTMETWR